MMASKGWPWRRVARRAKRVKTPTPMNTLLRRVENAMDGRDGAILEEISSQLEDRFNTYDAIINELVVEHNKSTAEFELMQTDLRRLATLVLEDPTAPIVRRDN